MLNDQEGYYDQQDDCTYSVAEVDCDSPSSFIAAGTGPSVESRLCSLEHVISRLRAQLPSLQQLIHSRRTHSCSLSYELMEHSSSPAQAHHQSRSPLCHRSPPPLKADRVTLPVVVSWCLVPSDCMFDRHIRGATTMEHPTSNVQGLPWCCIANRPDMSPN